MSFPPACSSVLSWSKRCPVSALPSRKMTLYSPLCCSLNFWTSLPAVSVSSGAEVKTSSIGPPACCCPPPHPAAPSNAAPASEVAFGALGCQISLADLCDRAPRPLAEGEVLDLGGKRVRQISTPHVPYGWEAQVMFEETTGTLLCGDLLTHAGRPPAVTTDDVVGPALEAEAMFHAMSGAPHTADVIRSLGDLRPTTLALMHGSSYRGDGHQVLYDLAAGIEAAAA